MTMDPNLDDDLRAWGATARAEAPAASMPRLHRGPDRRVLAAIGAAVVVFAAAVAVPLLTQHHEHAPTGGYQPVPTLEPGMQFAGQHGLLLQVPSSWTFDNEMCGTAQGNTVLKGYGSYAACLAHRPPGLSTVEFAERSALDDNSIVPGAVKPTWDPLRSTTLAGRPEQIRSGRAGELHLTQIGVASLRISVIIASPSQRTVDRISQSVRIVARDPAGCDISTRTSPLLVRDRAPVRAGADTALIPAGATSAVACSYGAGFLHKAVTISDVAFARLTSALASVPAGVSFTDPQNYAPDLCPRRGGLGDAFDPRSQDAEWTVLTVHYRSGPAVVITVRLGLCGDLGAANGSYGIQRTDAMIKLLTPYDAFSGWPGDMRTKK